MDEITWPGSKANWGIYFVAISDHFIGVYQCLLAKISPVFLTSQTFIVILTDEVKKSVHTLHLLVHFLNVQKNLLLINCN